MKLERLAISCGGTGGHFNPGLSIARRMKENGGEPVLVLGGKHAEKQAKTAAGYGIRTIQVSAVPPSKSPLKLLKFIKSTWTGVRSSKEFYAEFQPQALLCMGSYASLPPALAAKKVNLPLFLHDGNAKLGKANRFLSRWAKTIALSFPVKDPDAVCSCPGILTGMPLRPEIVRGVMSREKAIAEINARWNRSFSTEKPVVLIFGGSLGARTINTMTRIPSDLPGAETIQVIRLSGPGNLAEAEKCAEGSPADELVLEACQDMNILYSAADLVICRSGGSTVSELAVYGKYAVLIPYPFAAEDHQNDNARWLASTGGAEIIQNSECTQERFAHLFRAWFPNRVRFTERGKASLALAKPDAAQNVLDMIENILSSQTIKQ